LITIIILSYSKDCDFKELLSKFKHPNISRSAHLEIHTGIVVSAIVSDRIPCDRTAFP
jgi:hypothetical protein